MADVWCLKTASVLIMLGILFSVLAASNENKHTKNNLPVVVNTWGFTNATATAWSSLMQGSNGVDAVVDGCSACEVEQCDGTVGYGGSPDENSETTLDALVMDGKTHDIGAVGCLRGVKNAVAVARAVMLYSKHTMLVGELATAFAKEMGFEVTNLSTPDSIKKWQDWKDRDCQPNFRQNVTPDPKTNCGPYAPISVKSKSKSHPNAVLKTFKSSENKRYNKLVGKNNHDTIGMVIVDAEGNLAAGTSTNGASHKIPGRVGDSPIPGAGAYVDNDVGGAAATGDGDVMMRFLPSYHTVERMRNGDSPSEAAAEAMARIVRFYPNFSGAVVAVNKQGEHGAACYGIGQFPYSIRSHGMQNVTVETVPCIG